MQKSLWWKRQYETVRDTIWPQSQPILTWNSFFNWDSVTFSDLLVDYIRTIPTDILSLCIIPTSVDLRSRTNFKWFIPYCHPATQPFLYIQHCASVAAGHHYVGLLPTRTSQWGGMLYCSTVQIYHWESLLYWWYCDELDKYSIYW